MLEDLILQQEGSIEKGEMTYFSGGRLERRALDRLLGDITKLGKRIGNLSGDDLTRFHRILVEELEYYEKEEVSLKEVRHPAPSLDFPLLAMVMAPSNPLLSFRRSLIPGTLSVRRSVPSLSWPATRSSAPFACSPFTLARQRRERSAISSPSFISPGG